MISTLCVLAMATGLWAQSPQVLFYGYIEEGYFESNMPKKVKEEGAERLQGVKVKVMIGDETVHAITCRNTGFYAVLLKEDQMYHVVFEKDGYMQRTIELNTAGLELPNDEATIKCVADVSLFKTLENNAEVAQFVKAPFAKATFNKSSHEMEWDMKYTTELKQKFAMMAEPAYATQPAQAKKKK